MIKHEDATHGVTRHDIEMNQQALTVTSKDIVETTQKYSLSFTFLVQKSLIVKQTQVAYLADRQF